MRVLIADDHPLIRRGVIELVEANPDLNVCGEAGDGQTAVDLALKERPDVLVLDVSLPIINGVSVTRRLRQDLPSLPILMYTMHDDQETISGALSAGVRGYLLKSDRADHLAAAIVAVGAGRTYFSPIVTEFLLDAAVNDRKKSLLETFTVRELEVAQLIAEGYSNKQIAKRLGRSVKTIESHRSAGMRKAGARNGGEYVRFAIKQNLIRA